MTSSRFGMTRYSLSSPSSRVPGRVRCIGRIRCGVQIRVVVLHEVGRDVDGVFFRVVQVVHATRELRRNGATRLVFLLGEGLLLVLGRRRGTEVLGATGGVAAAVAAGSRRAAEAAAWPWAAEATAAAEAATATAEATRPRGTAEAAARPRRTAGLSGAGLADGQRTAHEQLAVEFLDGFFGGGALRVLNERKPAGAAGFPVERTHDLCGLADLREVSTQIVFGRLVGQIAHEQSDWWHW